MAADQTPNPLGPEVPEAAGARESSDRRDTDAPVERLAPLGALGILDASFFLLLDRLPLYLRTLFPFDLLAATTFVIMTASIVGTLPLPAGVPEFLPLQLTLLLVARTLAQGVFVRQLVRRVQGMRSSTWEAWGHVLRNPLAVLIPGLASMLLLTSVLFHALAAPALSIAQALAAVDGGRPWTVLRRARELVGDGTSRLAAVAFLQHVAGWILFISLFFLAPQLLYLGAAFLDIAPEAWAAQLVLTNELYLKTLWVLTLLVLGAHRASAIAVSYLDARVRAEGFDLRLRLAEAARQRRMSASAAAERAALLRDRRPPTSDGASLRRDRQTTP